MESSLRLLTRQLAHRRGDYGFDEPVWPILLGLVGVIFLVLGLVSFWVFAIPVLGVICFVCAIIFLFSAASYVYTKLCSIPRKSAISFFAFSGMDVIKNVK